jgi:hypothetical protein
MSNRHYVKSALGSGPAAAALEKEVAAALGGKIILRPQLPRQDLPYVPLETHRIRAVS